MSELDKFKRRLVRSVSRLLKQDREAQIATWEQLRKETGCDCKLLWERMRSLTIKKMKRLLAAGDRTENIASVARLSVTDWLLFDLVLVHDKLDVIGRDQLNKGGVENPVLEELFELVLDFDIERKAGTQLLQAWVDLTHFYNIKGRQCSPMLLQRRWFQLKQTTRANFYRLWNGYRGNAKLWEVARLQKPSALQSAIAKKYPQLITQPFPEWNELIQQQKVILPEQFDMQTRMKNCPKTLDEKPDILVIEPEIETIDLGDASDAETQNVANSQTSAENRVNLTLVKQEPVDDPVDGLSNVQILETSHIPIEFDEGNDSNLSAGLAEMQETQLKDLDSEMSCFIDATITDEASTSTIVNTDFETSVDEISNDLIKQKADEYVKSRLGKVLEQYGHSDAVDNSETVADVNNETADGDNNETADGDNNDTLDDDNTGTVDEDNDLVNDIIKQKANDFVRKVDIQKLVNDVVDEFQLPAGLTLADEGIELVDDGIELIADDNNAFGKKIKEEIMDPVVKTENKEEEQEDNEEMPIKEECPSSPKFDLKLLMEPVVYTTKLDDMIVFKGKKFDFVELQSVIDSIVIESKPVSKVSIKIEAEDDDNALSQSGLSQSDKLSNDDLFMDFSQADIESNLSKDNAVDPHLPRDDVVDPKLSKDDVVDPNLSKDGVVDPNSIQGTDLSPNDEDIENCSEDEYESDESIDENLKVKSSSYLLQKPKNRTYNSIILCKNPDFNTRLKRLTAGFFSSSRNRQLFSACKPMTIDLHKAFESKLVKGTLYIKSSGSSQQQVTEHTENAHSSSVVPSAMPIQSLLSKDNTNVNIHDLITSSPTQMDTVDLTQRSKTINLRDLSEIRRINQHLLTAQVPPMRMEDDCSVSRVGQSPTPPVASEGGIEGAINETDADKPIGQSDVPKLTNVAGSQDLPSHRPSPPAPVEPSEEFANVTTGAPAGDVTRGRGAARSRGRGGRWGRGGTTTPKPPYVPKYALKNINTAPSWLIRPLTQPPSTEEFLITIDTLNRMINKLDGTKEFKNPTKKNKRPNWRIDKSPLEPLLDTSKSINVAVNDATVGTDTDAANVTVSTSVPEAIIEVPVQTTVKKSTKSSNKTAKAGDERPVQTTVKTSKPTKITARGRRYCCWSREKIIKLNTSVRMYKVHTCSTLCVCCCRQELAIKMQYLTFSNKNVQQCACKEKPVIEDPIVLSDEEISMNSGADKDVLKPLDDQIPGIDSEQAVPKPRVHVNRFPPIAKSDITSSAGRGIPLSVDGVSAAQAKITSLEPVLRINVNFTPAAPSVVSADVNPSAEVANTSILQHIATQMTPNPAMAIPAPVPVVSQTSPNKITIPVAYQPTIAMQQGQIIVDGSGPYTCISTEKKDDRVLFLNSKTIAKKPKESPIFLGKNKILLTTVKFPADFEGRNALAEPPVNSTKVIPALALPAGVQLVLMPDGNLKYTVDASAQLDETQMSVMPDIIAAVQQQITQHTTTQSIPTVSCLEASNSVNSGHEIDEPTNKVLHDVQPSTEVSVSVQTVSVDDTNLEQSESTNVPNINDSEKDPSTNEVITANQAELAPYTTDSISEKNSSKDSEIITIEESDPCVGTTNISSNKDKEVNDEVTPPNQGEIAPDTTDSRSEINSSKGSEIITIEECDPCVETTSISSNKDKEVNDSTSSSRNLLSDLMEMSGISAEDAKPQEQPAEIISVGTNTEVQVVSTSESVNINSTSLPELSPITSLAELKYACDNNGLFYKLDLDSGIIAPINVCIKKTITKQQLQRTAVKTFPKSVIDLTNEEEKESPSNISKDGTVKPIKLFKRVVFKPKFFSKKRCAKKSEINIELIKTKRPRKQSFGKIEAKIDLVDSDAPMEEEYLLDSSGSDDETRKNIGNKIINKRNTPVLHSDDSSDEEPLAKKFMRLKQGNITSSTHPEKEGTSTNENVENAKDNPKSSDTDRPTESQNVEDVPLDLPVPTLDKKTLTVENVDDNLNSDEMDVEEPEFLTYLDEETESQDDCILGF